MDVDFLRVKMAKVLVFGSYKLGVHFKGTDIDTICVFPNFITKDEFQDGFKSFISGREGITNILQIREAQTPIIKLKINGISFDLLYASVDVDHINSQKDIEKVIMHE